MNILTNPLDKDISFKFRSAPYSEYEIVVTWGIIEATENEIKDIYLNGIHDSQLYRPIKKAKKIGLNLYLVPLTTIADCTSLVENVLKCDLCPTITPIELNYLYQKCPSEHRNNLDNIADIVF